MSVDVSDVRSNPRDQKAHAAQVLGRSEPRRRVFAAIHEGKKQIKTVTDIERLTGLPRKVVLNETRTLFNNQIVKSTKVNGELAYIKDPFFTANKKEILRLASDPKALTKFHTKANPKPINMVQVSIRVPRSTVNVRHVTVDDIDTFSNVRELPFDGSVAPVGEAEFKEGLKKIMGEEGQFVDWGGELNDLFTTRLELDGKRIRAAFGLKGKGTKGILTPKKMGKNADQIQRLFQAPADVYIVQYWGQIDESVIEQMNLIATAKSALEGRSVLYGIIDGQDTARILQAHPQCFV